MQKLSVLIAQLFFIVFFTLFCFAESYGQRTIGALALEDEAMEGYTFFSPFSSRSAYMVDNCGRLINTWPRGTRPGLSAYFLENGLMLRTYKVDPVGPFTSASNAGGVELVDWENNTVWSYEWNTPTELSHHDVVYMPNGNILMLVWELVYAEELIQLGRDPNEIAPQGYMWSEKIVELKPVGLSDIELVWEWKIRNHYIQDFDPIKDNYGIIGDHPERFDINLPDLETTNSFGTVDWNHFNAIDYNEALDQILISTRNSDEIWILDHSTSIEEAASHSGGRYNKGGDILYRWGNASAYDKASISDQRLFGQHGVHWIKDGLFEGAIMIFNNGNGRPEGAYSTTEIIAPPSNGPGEYFLEQNESYGPAEVIWKYGDKIDERHYSPYLSNSQILTNGNLLINAGSPGELYEINMEKEIVWQYINPLRNDTPLFQGSNPRQNSMFRAYKYPLTYKGFDELSITASDPLEASPDLLEACIISNTSELERKENNLTYSDRTLFIRSEKKIFSNIQIFSSTGKLLFQEEILGRSDIPLSLSYQGIAIIIIEGIKTSYKVLIL